MQNIQQLEDIYSVEMTKFMHKYDKSQLPAGPALGGWAPTETELWGPS